MPSEGQALNTGKIEISDRHFANIKASDLFVRALEAEGVEYIFGVPGEENLDLVESLRESKIKLVVTRHEQAAGFIAATIGRLTGRIGVCVSTLGPGATNFATALAYAHLGGFPCLFLTGQKPVRHSKQGAFQIVNIVDHFRSVSKHAKQIVDPSLIPTQIRDAVRIAHQEKPGPVHLELPEDIAGMQCSNAWLHSITAVRRPIAEYKAIAQCVALLKQARSPLLLLGAGTNRKRTQSMVASLTEKLGLPALCSQMGKGVLDERSEHFLGTTALSANDFVHAMIECSDCIILCGHDIVEKPPFFMKHGRSEQRKVIHLSFTRADVDEVYFPQLEVVGDIANALWQIQEAVGEKQPHWNFSKMYELREQLKAHLAPGYKDDRFPMHVGRVVGDIRKVMPDDGIVALDNGMYKIWFARAYEARQPNTVLLDNGLATMGAGLPSAMAARLVYPGQKVIAVAGDGGFMMNSQEVETCVRLQMDIVIVLLRDNALGMIKWKQKKNAMPDFGLDLGNPDFVAYAEAYGARGHRPSSAAEFHSILETALNTPGVHLIDTPITYQESDRLLLEELPAKIKAINDSGAYTIFTESKDESKDTTVSDSSPVSADPAPSPSLPPAPAPAASTASATAKTATKPKPKPETESKKGLASSYPYYLGGVAMTPNTDLEVLNKYTGEVATRCAQAGPKEVDAAIAQAEAAQPAMTKLPHYARKRILMAVVNEVRARAEEFAHALCIEAGKPIKDARGEVTRLVDTFEVAAEEAVRIYGEYTPLDISERAQGMSALVRRFPIGPVSMIAPFNFPLNLAAHKIAPAIAAGCTWVLKPASRTPVGSLMLGEILSRTELPQGSWSILPCTRDSADLFTVDPRLKLLSFTGSPGVGWALKAKAGKKKVVLELGGNAAVVVDDLSGGLDHIVDRIIVGAFYQSGQSCISVQRILIKDELYDQVKTALVAKAKALVMGDPLDPNTFVGPMIHDKEAKRLRSWIAEAVNNGGVQLTPEEKGLGEGRMVPAVIMEGVGKGCKLNDEEAFGPAAILVPYSTFTEALDIVNDSKFGLQVGIFTSDIHKAWQAWETCDVGGVVINDVPSVRVDSQPYGGVKDSGLGREGIRYAIEDMTELRPLILKGIGFP